jgi:DNA-binding response OmpR family regulator
MRRAKILIVEDEAAIRTGLADAFIYHGFDVATAEDGRDGLRKAHTGRFDLILLDVMLPGLDGFAVCDAIRVAAPEQPIIMLTARTSDEDIITGLKLGADDYVAKPFSVAELVLRAKAVLRRSGLDQRRPACIELEGDVSIDTQNLCGRRGDRELKFTRREIDMLGYLYANSRRPVSREEMLHKVWGYDRHADIETRTVDIHIAKLRRKIESDPSEPRVLVTIRGAGYRLLTESQDVSAPVD